MHCAPAFDSSEQLGQCAAATALLFNPMRKALEIRMWLVLVAFHATMSTGGKTMLQGSLKKQGCQFLRLQVVISAKIQPTPRPGEWRPHNRPFYCCQGRKQQPLRGDDFSSSLLNIVCRAVQNAWREIWKSSLFMAFTRNSFFLLISPCGETSKPKQINKAIHRKYPISLSSFYSLKTKSLNGRMSEDSLLLLTNRIEKLPPALMLHQFSSKLVKKTDFCPTT